MKIYPTQSTFGAREKYTVRVPNERESPTIRIEGEFPAGLDIYWAGWEADNPGGRPWREPGDLSHIEHGETEIGAKILLKISREFGKSIEWLLTGEEQK